jgi:hypothetical protein
MAGEARTTERVCDDDDDADFLDAMHRKHKHWDNAVEAREYAGAERTSSLVLLLRRACAILPLIPTTPIRNKSYRPKTCYTHTFKATKHGDVT